MREEGSREKIIHLFAAMAFLGLKNPFISVTKVNTGHWDIFMNDFEIENYVMSMEKFT